eukprot:123128_1
MQSKPSSNTKKMSISGGLELVLSTQQQRAIAYTKWEETFRLLLNEEINDAQYLEVVQDLMKQFQSVSKTMGETASYFDGKNLKKVSKMIRSLQELEKQKMNITLDMQQKIIAARPDTAHNHQHSCNHEHKQKDNNVLIWRPRLYKEKQQHSDNIEQINDLLAEIKELKDSLSTSQQIIIKGTKIQIQTSDDCKTKELKK